MCACVCVFQAEEGGVGAEDVGSAGEQEGADGAAGRTDEAAEGRRGDCFSRTPHTLSLPPPARTEGTVFTLSTVDTVPHPYYHWLRLRSPCLRCLLFIKFCIAA